MADIIKVKSIRRRVFGPTKRDLHSTMIQQKKFEMGHHAQLENFLTNHGLLLVQIIQSLGQTGAAVNDLRDLIQQSRGRPISEQRLEAVESIVDALSLQYQAADALITEQPPRAWDPGARPARPPGDESIAGEVHEIGGRLKALAEGSLEPQLVGMVANVENALLNIGAMVSELVGGGLAQRLESLHGSVSELRSQLQLQTEHTEGISTLLDAQSGQLHGAIEQLRTGAGPAGAPQDLAGRLDNVSNGLLNVGTMVSELTGRGFAQRLESLHGTLSELGSQLQLQAGHTGRISTLLEVQGGQLHGAIEQLRSQIETAGVPQELTGRLDNVSNALSNLAALTNGIAGPAHAEISGKLDNASNALLNISAMVSDLTGQGMAQRLDRVNEVVSELASLLKSQAGDAARMSILIDAQGGQLHGAIDGLRTRIETAGAPQELTGRLDNVSNALHNIGAMVGELTGQGLARRLESLHAAVSELGSRPNLQAGAAERVATLLDAQSGRLHGVIDGLRTRIETAGAPQEITGRLDNVSNALENIAALTSGIAGPAQAEIVGRLDNVLNALSNIAALSNGIAGPAQAEIVGRLDNVLNALSNIAALSNGIAGPAQAEIVGRLDNVSNALSNIAALASGIAGPAQAEIVGRLDNVSNALLNVGTMVSELVGGGLAQRLESLQNAMAVLENQLHVQTGHADGMNTLLDAQSEQMRAAIEQLHSRIESSGASHDVTGRLDNVSNALLNIGAMVSELVGGGLAQRLEGLQWAVSDVGTQLRSGRAEGAISLTDAQSGQMHDAIGELRARIESAGVSQEVTGRLDNVSNALSNINAMVSDLAGGALSQRLENLQGAVSELGAQLQLQTGHAERASTRLDAQDGQLNGAIEQLRSRVETAALNIAAAMTEFSGSAIPTRLSAIETAVRDMASAQPKTIQAKVPEPSPSWINDGAVQALAVAGMIHRQQHDAAAIKRLARKSAWKKAAAQPFERRLSQLEKLSPENYKTWLKLLEQGGEEYLRLPVASCAVWGNKYAHAFRDFCSLFMRGRVLDIGCGPSARPLYLQGYPADCVSAIEPTELQAEPEFEVVRGFAEFLPWPTASFHTVIASTSLDHMLSLPKALAEIERVLTPNGRFLVWIGSVPGAAQPAENGQTIEPLDAYHLFHIDAAWFEPMMAEWFVIEERQEFDGGSFAHVFYRFDKKP